MPLKVIEHEVESESETLTSIADKHGIADWNDLFRFNRDVLTSDPDDDDIVDMNLLPVGFKLRVPDHQDHKLGKEELIKRAKDAAKLLIGDKDPRWINPIERVSYTLLRGCAVKTELEGAKPPRASVERGGMGLKRLAGARFRIIDPDTSKRVHEAEWLELDFRGSFKVRLPRKTYRVEVQGWDYDFESEQEYNEFFDWTYLDPLGAAPAADAGPA